MEVIVVPIIFMLLFIYVFGGVFEAAVQTISGNYIDYMLPGILSMAIISGSIYTSLRLYNDREKGLLTRFHSMPVSHSSVLWAHALTSLVSTAVSVLIIIFAAFIIGFRSNTGILEWFIIMGILAIFTLALSWLAIIPGLIAKSKDGVLAFAYPLVFLPFISSAFVPTETMNDVVRIFAENQPITIIVDAIRNLLISNPIVNDILLAFAWCVVIMIVANILAMIVYKHDID
jgi:ABC-2 type transport system permease protein